MKNLKTAATLVATWAAATVVCLATMLAALVLAKALGLM